MRERDESTRDVRSELLRSRLRAIQERLDVATEESGGAGFFRVSAVLGGSIEQIRSLLDAPSLPATFYVESVIGRAEQALAVWLALKAF